MSRNKFTPGRKMTCFKVIKYTADYNNLFPNSNQINCLLTKDTFKKEIISSDSPSARLTNNQRISQLVNYSRGGKTQYGNFYLGQPLNVNYLGRMEGMPGGSGAPPSNF